MKIDFVFYLSLIFISCSDSGADLDEIQPYNGPIQVIKNMESYRSEASVVKMKMQAKHLEEYENGDKIFQEGLYLEFYDNEGRITSSLQADFSRYFKGQNYWYAECNVIINNVEKNEQLNTEEIYWNPETKTIYNDVFVKIILPDQVLYGEGIEAKQDFSEYSIKKPKGEFILSE